MTTLAKRPFQAGAPDAFHRPVARDAVDNAVGTAVEPYPFFDTSISRLDVLSEIVEKHTDDVSVKLANEALALSYITANKLFRRPVRRTPLIGVPVICHVFAGNGIHFHYAVEISFCCLSYLCPRRMRLANNVTGVLRRIARLQAGNGFRLRVFCIFAHTFHVIPFPQVAVSTVAIPNPSQFDSLTCDEYNGQIRNDSAFDAIAGRTQRLEQLSMSLDYLDGIEVGQVMTLGNVLKAIALATPRAHIDASA